MVINWEKKYIKLKNEFDIYKFNNSKTKDEKVDAVYELLKMNITGDNYSYFLHKLAGYELDILMEHIQKLTSQTLKEPSKEEK